MRNRGGHGYGGAMAFFLTFPGLEMVNQAVFCMSLNR